MRIVGNIQWCSKIVLYTFFVLLSITLWVWGVLWWGEKFSRHISVSRVPLSQQDRTYAIPWKILVSPFGVEEEVYALLTQTVFRLYMWQYSITKHESIQLFRNIAYRGAEVLVILENEMFGWNTKAWRDFLHKVSSSPIQVQSDEHLGLVYQHAKTFITDNHVIITTANIWFQWFRRNREYRFVTDYKPIVDNLTDLFQKDWQWKHIASEDIHHALLFCPLNCREKLHDFIESAEHTIFIQAQYLQDPVFLAQLKEKQDLWVSVQIIAWRFQDEDLLTWFENRYIMDTPYLHTKNILIDHNVLLIGSMNFSTNAIENNREISIITTDQESVDVFRRQFYVDWNRLHEEEL